MPIKLFGGKMFEGDSNITKSLPYGDTSVQRYLVTSGLPLESPKVAQTAYAHNAGNVISSKDTHALKFQENVLNNYDVITYHWKFYITSLENASSGNVLNLANQVVVAETGVTDLSMDKVEFNGIAVPSVETGTGTQTTLKFEVLEPSGCGLLDKMFYESVSLGIGNWLVMPCWLQLEFRGRDPVTSEALTQESGGVGGKKWLWPIKVTNVKANVSEVGTKYEFDAIVYNELAQSNSYFGIQHNITLRKIKTFQDAMADLEFKLNADQLAKTIDNYSVQDTYKIVIDPVFMMNDNGVITPPKDNENTSRAGDYEEFTDKAATYNTGTTIDKIIDSLLGNTKYYQTKMPNAPAPGAKPESIDSGKDQMKKFWRVVTESHPIEYDALRQDNAVAITIFVIEYDAGIIDVNAAQTGQTPETADASKRRVAEYSKKRILNKIYNYIFTGINDQVLTFDLNMNHSYAASLSRFGGIYSSTSSQTGEGVTAQKNAENEQEVTTQLRQTLEFINNAADDKGKEVDKKIKMMTSSIADSKLPEHTATRYKNILVKAKLARDTKIIHRPPGGVDLKGYDSRPDTYTSPVNSLAVPRNGQPVAFLSDIQLSAENTKSAYDTMIAIRKGKLRPIPFREGVQESHLGNLDPASNSGRNRLSSIFATALYSSVDASLQHVKITIKGDPYWLFPQPINNSQSKLEYNSEISISDPGRAITNIKNAHKIQSDAVNLFGTDNFIVIRFRTPKMQAEESGMVESFTDAEMFSGIYKVVTIISKFEGGRFVQELTCILDPVINIDDLREFLVDIEVTQGRNLQDPAIAADARTNFGKIDPRRFDISNVDRVNNVLGKTTGPTIPSLNLPKLPTLPTLKG